jgi:hypothetical protein
MGLIIYMSKLEGNKTLWFGQEKKQWRKFLVWWTSLDKQTN